MEAEGSLPQLELPATCLYPKPDNSSPLTYLKFRYLKLRWILLKVQGDSF